MVYFQRLQTSVIGCHIEGVFAGTFAVDYNIIFNPEKSKIIFYHMTNTNIIIEICGQPDNVVSQETYHGNYPSANIFDR